MSLTAYAAEETITIDPANDTLNNHQITNKLGANGTHGDFNDQGCIAWGQFIAPSGKVFTKIEVYGKEYEYDDETKKAWEWSGRAKIVSHDNFTDCDPYTSYNFTLDDAAPISQTVTFKVVNGSWNDETTTDKTVTLTGYEGDTLKLAADQIPTVGTKPNDTYKAGSWDVTPSTETEITAATTYTYTYVAKEASVVTKAPEAKTLTYNGSAQELVTAGEATGGEMQYALGTATEATQPYTTSIPTATDAGT